MVTLSRLKDVFDTNAKINEFILVLNKVKPSIRIICAKKDISRIMQLCEETHLFITTSPLQITCHTDESLGYSNKGEMKQDGDALLVYISIEEQTGLEACKAELDQDHMKLASCLGYPECCAEFFTKHTLTQQQQQNDYVKPMLKETAHTNLRKPYDWRLNLFLRYGDFSLISHFPCSLYCHLSIKLAEDYLAVLDAIRPMYVAQAQMLMRYTAVYIEDKGVYLLKDTKLNDNILHYTGVMSTVHNDMFDMLSKHTSLQLIDDKHIVCGDEKIKADVVQFE